MALALVTTVGGASTNSYATVAEADSYLEAHSDFSDWTVLAEAVKIKHLVQAARMIDQELFHGAKVSSTQSMRFPRTTQMNVDSYTVLTAIPPAVKNAQCEQAIYLMKHGHSRRMELRADGVKQISLGGRAGASESFVQGDLPLTLCPGALSQLSYYLSRTCGVI